MAKEKYKSAYIYTDEDYDNDIKEHTRYMAEKIASKINEERGYSVLDVGCAKGKFLYYLKNNISRFSEMAGIDYSRELIDAAKRFEGLKGVDFYCEQAQSFDLGRQFDFINLMI
jgi:2-polyprenyl-3-methyl-5-hydroxy-6-metoxy-1,4-benzoquinol methylase